MSAPRSRGADCPGATRPGRIGRRRLTPKETRDFAGRPHILEHGITTDFALVRAWRGDRHGNLRFRRAAANFNPLAAMAGRITVAEVEELVEPGALAPDEIHLPGIYVRRVVQLTAAEAADKHIEHLSVSASSTRGAVRA